MAKAKKTAAAPVEAAPAVPKLQQSYELVVIFTPVLAEDEYKAMQDRFTSIITEAGGEVSATEAWGMRGLAYPIAKKTTGLYWLLQYRASTDVNARLELQMNREESVLRHMITRLDKYALEYSQRRRGKLREAAENPQRENANAETTFDNA
jgi:small subunit ribosomal protein S6